MSVDGSGESVIEVDLSNAVQVNQPIQVPNTKLLKVTGFIVLDGVPAGTTFRVFRTGTPTGAVFGNRGSLLAAWCAMDDGLSYMYDVATPGAIVRLLVFTAPNPAGGSYS